LIELGQVTDNRPLAENISEMSINLPEIAELYQGPGQFIALLPGASWENPLRRPMSISSVEGNIVSIIFKVLGPGTRKLSRLRSGDSIDILGPLGNTFSLTPEFQPVLVGGGVGLAPMLNLYDLFIKRNFEPILILGARSDKEHFMEHEPDNNIWLTTDDGSSGNHGTVLPTLENILGTSGEKVIYSCGPEPMLKAVQEVALKNNVSAELSVESYMGCGVGICQGCVIQRKREKIKEHSYHEKYALVCTEGPVFSAGEVKFG